MNTIKSKVLGIALGVSGVLPFTAFAQTEQLPGAKCTSLQSCLGLIQKINNYAFAVLLVVAVSFIIWAAFLYLSASGNEERVGKAKTMIIYAAIAIGIAVLAQTVVAIVKGVVGGDI